MANELPRLMLFDHEDAFIRDLDPDSVWRAYTISEVNGEHSLTIETTDELTEGDRIVWRDGMLLWHEHVVTGQVSERNVGGVVVHSYWCAWSLQYDLANTFVSAMPGTVTPVGPRAALEAALGGTQRWTVGTVSQGGTNGASFFRMSGWEAMQELVETWGGEVSVTITVGAAGVTSRQVNLLSHEGNETPTRRFDYAGDLSGIKRTLPEQPWAARVIPLGKAQQTEGGGYGRRTTIESVNGGVMWLQNAAVVPFVRVPDGQGGWEVPVRKVETDAYDDPAALKAWAQDHLTEWTTPQASYEADVVQLTRAGLDAQGVALGDEIVVVDRTFGPSGIAIQGRALRIEEDLRDPAQTRITVSSLRDTLGDQLGGLARRVDIISNQSADTGEYQSTRNYLSRLLGRLNDEANFLGGYTYITEGAGLRTYDRPVSNPAVGAEATKVVEIKGGTIRIADSRTSGGDWDWRTVFVAGHIAAELVTAAQITAGYIGSAESGNYWDLDAGTMVLSADLNLGGLNNQNGILRVYDASGNLIGKWDNSGLEATGNLKLEVAGPSGYNNAREYVQLGNFSFTDASGRYNGVKTSQNFYGLSLSNSESGIGHVMLANYGGSSAGNPAAIFATKNFVIMSNVGNASAGFLYLSSAKFELGNGFTTISGKSLNFLIERGSTEVVDVRTASTAFKHQVNVHGALYVTGTKSRVVATKDYGNRELYAYETPAPYFGDIGSATIGEDGTCYVSIDDIFAETARTDMAYQVFLQACGRGELWVEEKHPSYFVVRGAPGLAFDWEVKARQKDFEMDRIEDNDLSINDELGAVSDIISEFEHGSVYDYELNYARHIERLY